MLGRCKTTGIYVYIYVYVYIWIYVCGYIYGGELFDLLNEINDVKCLKDAKQQV
jgi:hypothetical protein